MQVTFQAPPGVLQVRAGRQSQLIEHGGGPGSVVIEDLAPRERVLIELRHGRAANSRQVAARTLASPPGAQLSRVATISDLHLGSRVHGLAKTMMDRSGLADPAPLRCARGAIGESTAWGAQVLVGKGDLTQNGWATEWHQLGGLLDRYAQGVVRLGLPGNHDTPRRRNIEPAAGLGRAGFPSAGLTSGEPEWHDLDGVRVVAADSTVEHEAWGTLSRHHDAVLDLAVDAARSGRAVLLCLHHPLERAPVQLQYPRGVPWAEGRRFARRLAQANPRCLITAGHTHRNRRRRVGPVLHTEVASTKDWPGVWAGYAVHEGGIRQVVRRIAAADAMGWIDYTRWAAGGLWWFYSPGRLSDRCFTYRWPTRSTRSTRST